VPSSGLSTSPLVMSDLMSFLCIRSRRIPVFEAGLLTTQLVLNLASGDEQGTSFVCLGHPNFDGHGYSSTSSD